MAPQQPDATTVAETLALVQAQSKARAEINTLVTAQVVEAVRDFGGWYDDAQTRVWAARLAKLTRTGQRQTALSTGSFARRILRLLSGGRTSTATRIDIAALWGDVPLETVYARLPVEYRWLEKTRGPNSTPELRISPQTGRELPQLNLDAILDRVATRADVQADTALTLAFREQWVSDLAGVGEVAGYRRIVHPELSAGGSCGLCLVATNRVYLKADLLPVHARCACTVAPIIGEPLGPGDPGSAINDQDLKAFYEAAGDANAANLKATKFKVVDHGELGPQLVYQGQHFRTPEQAEKTKKRAEANRSAAGRSTSAH